MGQIQGDLSVMPLSDLAIWFANRSVTGLLKVQQGAVTKEFYLRGGLAVRAASSDPRETLGQFLIHFGLITEDQLQRAFETQRETNVLLGRILVMIGIVREEHVIQALQVKISETLLDAFRWSVGRFVFEEAPLEDVRPSVEVAVSLVEVHREGLERAAMWDEFKRIFPTSSTLIDVNELAIPDDATPDTLDGRIISLARHGLSLEAIGLELHATDYQVAARLFELYRAGVVSPREPSASYKLSDMTIPPGKMTHADLARKALAKSDFASALRHAKVSAETEPSEDSAALSEQIEGKMREDLQRADIERDAVPALVRPLDEHQVRRLSAKARYMLARIDGKRTVQAIIQVSPMRDLEALDILRNLVRDGVVRL
jgi:hypothetical protein